MSYDVEVAGEWFNYTSNMRQMFKAFDVYPPEWDGKQAGLIAARISTAVAQIVTRPEMELTKFNMPNGWGTWTSALRFLMEVRDACRANPHAIVRVSA